MRPTELTIARVPFAWRWAAKGVGRLEQAFAKHRSADAPADDVRIRIFFLLALFLAGFVGLGIWAAHCALASEGTVRGDLGPPPEALRADLVDRQGNLLAVDLPYYGLYVDPREIWDSEEIQRVLPTALPALSPERLAKALGSNHREHVLSGVKPEDKARIQDMGLPGVGFEEEQHRYYPLGSTGAHVIGYASNGGEGVSGAELAFDEEIRGQAGQDAVPLSVDLRVQGALDDELEKTAIKFGVQEAVGIVTNIHTGEILGMSSWPGYDPNVPNQSPPTSRINRAVSSVYEPGSVFKVFSMAMGLDSGSATMTSTFDVSPLHIGNRTIHDFHKVTGFLPLPEVFLHSSNIGTARMALQAGAPNMTRYFKAFGLFGPARTELQEYAKPLVPRTWPETTVASVSFGQSISVSPLALARGMGAILNGGQMIPLTLRKVDPAHRPTGERVVSEETARKMLDLMRLNVTAKEGSGGKADVPGLSVGGKTGTAQLVIDRKYSKDRVLASFAAVFPTDGPVSADRYFVLIMLKDPKRLPETYGFATAGWNAAPAAGRVIDRIADFVGVSRTVAANTPSPIAAQAIPSGDEGTEAEAEAPQ
jgi:cell division protein FtsI (penicillin-binding protein 3)